MDIPAPVRDPEYRDELLGFIQQKMNEHPRGRQTLLGPSEIGGCPRGLAWKLHFGASDGKQQGWAAGKGVIMHNWLDEEVFSRQEPRFRSDLKLPQVVPWVDGGTLDLYDTKSPPTVVDFKAPGDPSMSKARRGKPPGGYYVQVNTYALGLTVNLNLPVERVALLYLPMAGDDLWGEAKGAVLLTWPVDFQVALDHLREVKRIDDLQKEVGLDAAMRALSTRDDFCHNRPCWRGNKHPQAICGGHRKGVTKLIDPNNPFS